jgi:short-subunit dehydrogenase
LPSTEKNYNCFPHNYTVVPAAGILTTGSIEVMTMDQYDELMNINCRSIVLLMKLCTPHLIESKGNIVNVSSVTGLRAVSVV